MRKITYGLCASCLLLLLVGAGCARPQNAEVKTGAEVGAPKAPVSVDAAVDGILKDGDAEQAEQTRFEADAEAINADSAELNAYGNISYDVE